MDYAEYGRLWNAGFCRNLANGTMRAWFALGSVPVPRLVYWGARLATGLNDHEILWVIAACLNMSTYIAAICHRSSSWSSQNYWQNSHHIDKSFSQFNHCLFAHYERNNARQVIQRINRDLKLIKRVTMVCGRWPWLHREHDSGGWDHFAAGVSSQVTA